MQTVLIGIDLGGTNVQGAVATPAGEVTRRGKISTRTQLGADLVLADLAKFILDLAEGRPIQAAGLGVPGLLDVDAGICRFSCNLGWENVPIARELSGQINAPVYIDNDVRVAALGEWSRGQARDCKDFIFLAVGTGIGSGIVSGGQLLRGPGWSAGESGHMVLDPQGPDCACGSKGCLETLASATAIARDGLAAAKANPGSLLHELAAGRDLDAALVFKAAAQGDAPARQVVDTAMAWLGLGIANLVNIFNPRKVIIGGGVSLAGEQLLAPVKAQVARYAMPVQREMAEITVSSLADRAGVYGALELARQKGATGDCPQWSKGAKYGR